MVAHPENGRRDRSVLKEKEVKDDQVALILQQVIEVTEERGMPLPQAVADLKEVTANMTEAYWNMRHCPCCRSFAEHQQLANMIVAALEEKGRN